MGASNSVAISWLDDACLEAARLAALAFAICSRNAADDFRFVNGESPLAADTDALGKGRASDSPHAVSVAAAESTREGNDVFLKSPVAEGLGFVGRAAIVLPPDLDGTGPKALLSRLGLRAASGTGMDGTLIVVGFVAEGIRARLGVASFWVGFGMPKPDALRGVPLIVERLLLKEATPPRKADVAASSRPALDPGRLPCPDDARAEDSEL